MAMTSATGLAWQLAAAAAVAAVPFTTVLAVRDGSSMWSFDGFPLGSLFGAAYGAVAVVLLRRAPTNLVARLLCVVGAGFAWSELAGAYAHRGLVTAPGSLPGAPTASWFATWLWVPAFAVLLTWLPLLVPDGAPPGGRWRWLSRACAAPLVLWGSVAVLAWPYRGARLVADPPRVESTFIDVLGGVAFITLLVLVPLCLVSLVWRYRQADVTRRAQLRIVVAAGVATVSVVAVANAVSAPPAVQLVAVPLLPVALLIAVLRYRLFDIDLIISRSLVYVVLTAGVVAIYVAVVGVAGAAFGLTGAGPSLVATALVALLFQPANQQLRRVVTRSVYGDRDPYDAISRLGPQLQAVGRADELLPGLCRTVAEALRVPAVTIELRAADGRLLEASCGPPADVVVSVPLLRGNVPIGRLGVAPRRGQRRFSAADQRLIDALVPVVSLAALSATLSDDLARSRERLITAREEERRRLRRDLHDGLGPVLAGITLEIQAAANLLDLDITATREVLAAAEGRARRAVEEVRRVVYGLRPPVLDHLGLVRAIEEHAATLTGATVDGCGVVVVVESSGNLDDLPAAVEVAAYMVALEALTNVVRHAAARTCAVALRGDHALHVVVRDDGKGAADRLLAGVGLTSMRERTEELGGSLTIETSDGGGLCVTAHLPKQVATR